MGLLSKYFNETLSRSWHITTHILSSEYVMSAKLWLVWRMHYKFRGMWHITLPWLHLWWVITLEWVLFVYKIYFHDAWCGVDISLNCWNEECAIIVIIIWLAAQKRQIMLMRQRTPTYLCIVFTINYINFDHAIIFIDVVFNHYAVTFTLFCFSAKHRKNLKVLVHCEFTFLQICCNLIFQI